MNAGSDVTGESSETSGHRAGSPASEASTAGTPPARARLSMSPVPTGATSAITGTRAATSANSRNGSDSPRRPATAHRWMIAFVDPPTAASTVIARSNPEGVSNDEGRTSSDTRSTIRRPASSASTSCRGEPDARTAEPGSVMPSVSAMIAIVDAVPIVLHAPSPRPRQVSGHPGHSRLAGEQGRAVTAAGQPAPDPVQLRRDLSPAGSAGQTSRGHRTGKPSPAAPGLD